MQKIDFKKELKHLYNPSVDECAIVKVPAMNYLMIDGHGDPNTSKAFTDAIEALYPVAYKLKFTMKNEHHFDYVVPPLEGLWWAEDMNDFKLGNKQNWDWTLMIMQPEQVMPELVEYAIEQVRVKKDPPALNKLRYQRFEEGPCAQIMHLGPYADEAPTIEKLHSFIADQGYERRGKHHEIYLSDFRKTAPEKMKTVIRQGVG